MSDCGGCQGQGSHRRWCEAVVGRPAAMFGVLAARAESLGDQVGANHPEAANALYAASGMLGHEAKQRALAFVQDQLAEG